MEIATVLRRIRSPVTVGVSSPLTFSRRLLFAAVLARLFHVVGVIAWMTFGALIAITVFRFGISHHPFCGLFE
jgi:hypothetical protein